MSMRLAGSIDLLGMQVSVLALGAAALLFFMGANPVGLPSFGPVSGALLFAILAAVALQMLEPMLAGAVGA